ncbi:MAG: cation-translocating P-type ATPase [Anaeroplasma sp.]
MNKRNDELIKEFNTDPINGLKSEQVIINQDKYGKNELEEKKKRNIFIKFLLQFKDFLIIILLIAAVVSVIVDPSDFVDSLIILFVVVFNAILGLIQESNAEKSLEALKKMSSLNSNVYRNGVLLSIPSSEVVVGDIIYVEAGGSVPADARIISCSNLEIDESALTGESLPVKKIADYIDDDNIPLGERKNEIFSSTNVINGKCLAVVTAVGVNTEIGKIAGMLTSEAEQTTPLQHKLNFVGKVIGGLSIIICIVVFILEYITTRDMLESFKSAIALAVAAIPEGLATVVTIVLAIGVGKMSKKNAIVKKLPAVETLGSCNVVCSDKTGTLTQNKMTVVKTFDGQLGLPNGANKKMLKYFAICCDAKISEVDGELKRIGDPTELALLDANNVYGLEISEKRLLDIPFDSERKLMTTVIYENNKYISITKGAPDIIINKAINNDFAIKCLKANDEMAESALRVLALAIKEFDYMPNINELENDFTIIGLVGMIDPARPEVKQSIELAKKAGIKTVMITGDHIVTAKAIAAELGILGENDKAITSLELEQLTDEYLENHISEYSVYARVAPKDKVRIVKAWQKNKCVVAMTGDGVNDAPALKSADIGCAMGITGTDVSKEAADMILTDDNFSSIIVAVKQGRGVYNNIQKCVKYLLSSNIGEVITIFVASLLSVFGLKLGVPLLPIHLLWINLLTDSLPAFGIAMEEVNDDVMTVKPKPVNESFFANKLGLKIAFEGILIGILTLVSYIIGNNIFESHIVGQTMAFLTLSTTQLFHAFNVKSDKSIFSKSTFNNKILNIAFIIGFLLQLFIIYCPGVNDIFKFTALNISSFLISIGLSSIIIVVMEFGKLIKKINRKQN